MRTVVFVRNSRTKTGWYVEKLKTGNQYVTGFEIKVKARTARQLMLLPAPAVRNVDWQTGPTLRKVLYMMERIYGWTGGGIGIWAVLAILVVLVVVIKKLSRK